jgi:hypothetical protein
MLLVTEASASYQLLGKLDELSDDQKKPRDEQGNCAMISRGETLSVCRGHFCHKVAEWLVGLLGKIAVQCANLL